MHFAAPLKMKKITKHRVLDENFFAGDTLEVARNMLGKYIIRHNAGYKLSLKITDVEAYDGFEDKASHARFGRTPRSEVMFGPPGRIYIYLIYGMYWMLNIVTREKGYPAAILIRGTEEIYGPGRIGKYLELKSALNTKIAIPENGLWLEDRGIILPRNAIQERPRVGVDYAGPVWSEKLYRFSWSGGRGRDRTADPRLMSPVLHRLSYPATNVDTLAINENSSNTPKTSFKNQ